MKKKVCIIAIIIFLLILLIPIPLHYKDGGTVEYKAILYSVKNNHYMTDGGNMIGTEVRILWFTVYDDTEFIPD